MDADELRSFVPVWLAAQLDPGREGGRRAQVDGALVFADVSGFTALSTALVAKHGASGAERLSSALDTFFAALLDEVRRAGGVPISFAGDGLLACFPALDGDLAAATLGAARSALAMIDRVALLGPVEGVEMGLHTAVVAGSLELAALGGHRASHAAVILGAPVRRLGVVFAGTRRGQAVIDAEALALVARLVSTTPIDAERSSLSRVRVGSRGARVRVRSVAAIDTWVPDAVRKRADLPLGHWGAELRTLSLLFVLLGPVPVDGACRASDAVRAIQEELELHHGSLHQVTVDEKGLAVTAAFGLGAPAGDRPAVSAVRTALALVDRLTTLEIQPRIGVATGRVFVGAVGDTERRELAIVGTTMIRAARIAQASLGVAIDDATRLGVGGAVAVAAAPEVQVRGESVPVWRPSPGRVRTRATESLVGRAPVRALLERVVERLATAKEGRLIALAGPAGIGKSRLAAHAADVARDAKLAVLEITGDLPSVDRPYHGLRAELERRLDVGDHAGGAARLARLEEALREAGLSPADVPLLGPVLGMALDDTPRLAELGAQRRAELAEERVVRLLGRDEPRLVIVDDAQWLDDATALVLERLAAAEGPQLTLLCTRVPESELPAPLARLAARADRIVLGGLDGAEIDALVAAQIGATHVPAELAHWIGARAGGNPFFVREVAASLVSAGLVRVEKGAVVHEASREELDRAAPPLSVEAVVTGRIDGLDANAQLALKTASVLGLRFSPELLAELHPRGPEDAWVGLRALESAGLVRASDEGVLEVAHRIVLDVAYGLLPRELRAQLHEAAARRLEAVGEADASELAWHWEHAGDAPRALRWLDLAFERAHRAGALVESHSLARRAQALTPAHDGLRRGRWLRRMAETSAWLSMHQRSIDEARDALAALGRPMPDDRRAWQRRLVREVAGQLAHRVVSGRLWAHGTEADTEAALALARAGEGYYFTQGDQVLALGCFLASVNAAERVGTDTVGRVPNSFGVIGTALAALGLGRAGRRYQERALAAAEAAGEHAQIAEALFHIAAREAMGGAWGASDRTYEACAQHCRDAGLRHSLMFMRGAQGVNAMLRGDVDFVDELATETEALAAQLRHERGASVGGMLRAMVALHRGDTKKAIPLARRARDAMRARGDVGWTYPVGTLGRALVLEGEVASAVEEARTVLAVLGRSRPPDYRRLEGYAAAAEILVRVPDAGEDLARAIALLGRFARVHGIGHARHQLISGIVLARTGDPRGAERALERAVREATARELVLDAARAKLSLARVRGDRTLEAEARAWLGDRGIALASVEVSW